MGSLFQPLYRRDGWRWSFRLLATRRAFRTGRVSTLRKSPKQRRGENLGCESGGGVANVTDRDRAGEGAGDVEADSGWWRVCAGADREVGGDTESSWGADGSIVCTRAETWAGGKDPDSG